MVGQFIYKKFCRIFYKYASLTNEFFLKNDNLSKIEHIDDIKEDQSLPAFLKVYFFY